MSKLVKIIVGVLLIGLGIFTVAVWWNDFLALVRGGVGIMLIAAGLISFALLD